MPAEKLLKVKNLQKIYQERIVLDIDDLYFEKSKIYAIVGPNGSGKTTLINILNLLDKPTSAQLFFKGKDVFKSSSSEILKIRRQMTLVHQRPFLFQTTVFNNVAYGLKIRGYSVEEQQRRVRDALKIVGLLEFENRDAQKLSGGEAQRIVIARSLAVNPDILFMDEPTSNIDQRYIDVIERIIRKINQEIKTTVIFTTHDLSQAYRLADKIISLLDGKIVSHVPENIFKGTIIHENNQQWLSVHEKIKFSIVTHKYGTAYIYIDPSDIILSCEQFSSSARNSFQGKIVSISEQNNLIRLAVDIGVQLISVITKESFKEMNLNIGRKVCLTFKASAVKCY